jgi:hypothetical protein
VWSAEVAHHARDQQPDRQQDDDEVDRPEGGPVRAELRVARCHSRRICHRAVGQSTPFPGRRWNGGSAPPHPALQIGQIELDDDRPSMRAPCLEVHGVEPVEQRPGLLGGDLLARPDRSVAGHRGEQVVEGVLDRGPAIEIRELLCQIREERRHRDPSKRRRCPLDREALAAEVLHLQPEPPNLPRVGLQRPRGDRCERDDLGEQERLESARAAAASRRRWKSIRSWLACWSMTTSRPPAPSQTR